MLMMLLHASVRKELSRKKGGRDEVCGRGDTKRSGTFIRMSDELTNIESLQSSSNDFAEQSTNDIEPQYDDDDEYQSKEKIIAVSGSFIKLTEVHFYDKIQRPKTKKKKKKNGNNKVLHLIA